MALHREQLDEMGCSAPGCDHTSHDGPLVFHSACHPDSPTWVDYSADTGILRVYCAECERDICQVAIAA